MTPLFLIKTLTLFLLQVQMFVFNFYVDQMKNDHMGMACGMYGE